MSNSSALSALASVQVKICGLTRLDEAIACAELGADAIGLVFYPPSPRFLTDAAAREISLGLPKSVRKIGVFVDEPFLEVLKRVEFCGLDGVQLHGVETPEMVEAVSSAGITVIKSVFMRKDPHLGDAQFYQASAYLLESGEGQLPGGNAHAWNWRSAAYFSDKYPCMLAGGLDATNVADGIEGFRPDAVDVSSGVESVRGRKDIGKVAAFIKAVRNAKVLREPRRIFR
jgi:phosphoribosylanthranilate isomerase